MLICLPIILGSVELAAGICNMFSFITKREGKISNAVYLLFDGIAFICFGAISKNPELKITTGICFIIAAAIGTGMLTGKAISKSLE